MEAVERAATMWSSSATSPAAALVSRMAPSAVRSRLRLLLLSTQLRRRVRALRFASSNENLRLFPDFCSKCEVMEVLGLVGRVDVSMLKMDQLKFTRLRVRVRC